MGKYDGANGIAAAVGHTYVHSTTTTQTVQCDGLRFSNRSDEMFKFGAYLRETLQSPETAFTYEPNAAALSVGFNEKKDLFQWLETPGREYSLYRFGMAMLGMSKGSPDAILRGQCTLGRCFGSELIAPYLGYEWEELPKGSLVVDVGGGLGDVTKVIAKARPDLKYIVQDRAATIEKAVKVSRLFVRLVASDAKLTHTSIVGLERRRPRRDFVRTCDLAR
jgi:hypothetical protein